MKPLLTYAELEWEARNYPRARIFDDGYFSSADGIGESQAVFLHGNDLPQRWQHVASQSPFVIAESGFGTGLNFLLTAHTFLQQASSTQRLHFLSIEAFPLAPKDLAKALSVWQSLRSLSAELQAQYPPPVPGCHRLLFADGRVVLDLWLGDIFEVLAQWSDDPDGVVDAWYLDGFAPSKNPRMWQAPLFQEMARLSRGGATFSTFTAAGQVRRDLQAAGFVVQKRPGFGGKREHLSGHFPMPAQPPHWRTPPWFRRPRHPLTPSTALIIGAGLAGTATALSLARRGWSCVLIDQAAQLASGASGNRQGILYPHLSTAWRDPASQFFLHAWLYAQRHLNRLQAQGFHFAQARCGVLLCHDLAQLRKIWQNQPLSEDIAQWLGAEQIDNHWHTEGLLFSTAGWLSPPELCQAQWQAARAYGTQQLKLNCAVTRIQRTQGAWHLYQGQEKIATGELLVVANAYGAGRLLWNTPLTLQNVRGQVSHLSATSESLSLNRVLCSKGYITPAWQGIHCIGAIYDRNNLMPDVQESDNQKNLQQLSENFPALAAALNSTHLRLSARSSLRCSSRDHLPLLGNLPNYSAFMQYYQLLNLGKRFAEYPQRPPFENLYVNLAHGSRGLLSTALGAEVLAGHIHAEPLPCSSAVYQAIAAQRFWVRGLRH